VNAENHPEHFPPLPVRPNMDAIRNRVRLAHRAPISRRATNATRTNLLQLPYPRLTQAGRKLC
jgi:hypothetical protein